MATAPIAGNPGNNNNIGSGSHPIAVPGILPQPTPNPNSSKTCPAG
jgi:hypothetical protein